MAHHNQRQKNLLSKKEHGRFKKSTDYETFRPQKMVLPASIFPQKVIAKREGSPERAKPKRAVTAATDTRETSEEKSETSLAQEEEETTATGSHFQKKEKIKPDAVPQKKQATDKPPSVKDMEEVKVTVLGKNAGPPGKFVLISDTRTPPGQYYQTLDASGRKNDVRDLTVLEAPTQQPTYDKTHGSQLYKSKSDKEAKRPQRLSVQPAESYEILPSVTKSSKPKSVKSNREVATVPATQYMSARSRLTPDTAVGSEDEVEGQPMFDTTASKKSVISTSPSFIKKRDKRDERQKKRKKCVIVSVIVGTVVLVLTIVIVVIVIVVAK